MSEAPKNRRERRGRGDRRSPYDPCGMARLGRARNTPASLYTHVIRECDRRCPMHKGRRWHRLAIQPLRPGPVAAAVKPVVRVMSPMSFERRLDAYLKQNRNRPLTDRQWKRLWDTEISGWDYAEMRAIAERLRGNRSGAPATQ